MQLFKGTLSAGVDNLIKKPLGNAAKKEAVAQLADVFGQLNGEINNKNMDTILAAIQKDLDNDGLYHKFKDHIEIELLCFFYQKWSDAIRSTVVDAIVAVLKAESALVKTDKGYLYNSVQDDMHKANMIATVHKISQAVKTAISNQSQGVALEAAIKAINVQAVCASLAAGANASEYVHLVITDPKKTKLLPYLLRAGVNPTDIYSVEGVGAAFAEGSTSIGKFLATPVRLLAKVATENAKKGFNLLSLASRYNNVEAVKCLLANDHAVYYNSQIQDAINCQVDIAGKYNNGTALTIALMNCEKSKEAREIAKQLLRAGTMLSTIKGGNDLQYPHYNNLQLIAKFGYEDLLMEALNIESKPLSYLYDLKQAAQYKSNCNKLKSKSCYAVRELIAKYAKDMLAIYDDVMARIDQEIQRRQHHLEESAEPEIEVIEDYTQQTEPGQTANASGGLLGIFSLFATHEDSTPASVNIDNDNNAPATTSAQVQAAVAAMVDEEPAPAPVAPPAPVVEPIEEEQPGWGERAVDYVTEKLFGGLFAGGYDDYYDDQESNSNAPN